MAKDFRLVDSTSTYRTAVLEKASATVIEDGDFVELSSGLAVKATATGAALAYCVGGGAAGETTITVVADKNAVYEGTADANFAKTNRNAEVDLVVNSGVQQIDLGASTTDVLKVLGGVNAGTVGAATKVRVKINKMIDC